MPRFRVTVPPAPLGRQKGQPVRVVVEGGSAWSPDSPQEFLVPEGEVVEFDAAAPDPASVVDGIFLSVRATYSNPAGSRRSVLVLEPVPVS
mgnify:CR=1 FL=1